MEETTFENAKVGDRVWDIARGWGAINEIRKPSEYPLKVNFDNGRFESYDLSGRALPQDINQTLFWAEISITPPPRLKRKVVRTVERWVNVYRGYEQSSWFSKEEADRNGPGRIACVHLTGTYETEE